MAKLHFFYSTMNAGKSTSLLQSNHNYLENNLETLLFLPKENISFNEGKIVQE
ncbi:MAG: thymidine kinase [SAR86 cluster bacterium SAR86B]|uniref:thymidine kinase n=1 Tax=SAR86 cluster bacterium SAR86B TaxID=1123867 RepID=J4V210_9GAMM|nr:MAG: thymidine kinase [SAR86 cluster bacterium SAR86B]